MALREVLSALESYFIYLPFYHTLIDFIGNRQCQRESGNLLDCLNFKEEESPFLLSFLQVSRQIALDPDDLCKWDKVHQGSWAQEPAGVGPVSLIRNVGSGPVPTMEPCCDSMAHGRQQPSRSSSLTHGLLVGMQAWNWPISW